MKGLILSGVGDLPMMLPILNSVKLESCPTEAPLKLVCWIPEPTVSFKAALDEVSALKNPSPVELVWPVLGEIFYSFSCWEEKGPPYLSKLPLPFLFVCDEALWAY